MINTADKMIVEQRPNMRGGPGTVTITHYLKPEDFKAKCRLCARLTLPPGAGIGAHKHETEDELFLLLSGEGTIEDNGVAKRVSAGDAIVTGNGASHSIVNTGTANLEIAAVIMCY